MPDRASAIDAFLKTTDWAASSRAPLAGDASLRKYLRIGPNTAGTPAVLMDADPTLGNDTRPFIEITAYLRSLNLSAPTIYAHDDARGFLLLEDLGDDLFARVVSRTPELETTLYTAATDVLLHLHAAKPPALGLYDGIFMTQMAALAYDWYAYGALGEKPNQTQDDFQHSFLDLLETDIDPPSVLIQRDYHAENLLWLPDRTGHGRVGLLDYQDALLGHPAYDLVSLLKDARRDVSPDLEDAMIAHYVAQSDQTEDRFRRAYHVLGLQRNLRILGVFARLSMHFGKATYIDLIPRVWGYIERDLATPYCAPVADQIRRDLPAPTPAILQRLKDKCGTVPTR